MLDRSGESAAGWIPLEVISDFSGEPTRMAWRQFFPFLILIAAHSVSFVIILAVVVLTQDEKGLKDLSSPHPPCSHPSHPISPADPGGLTARP
jgi:hypothetical protein